RTEADGDAPAYRRRSRHRARRLWAGLLAEEGDLEPLSKAAEGLARRARPPRHLRRGGAQPRRRPDARRARGRRRRARARRRARPRRHRARLPAEPHRGAAQPDAARRPAGDPRRRQHADADRALRHAARPVAARAGGRVPRPAHDAGRGEGRPPAGDADRADDPFHPADPAHRADRPRRHPDLSHLPPLTAPRAGSAGAESTRRLPSPGRRATPEVTREPTTRFPRTPLTHNILMTQLPYAGHLQGGCPDLVAWSAVIYDGKYRT